MSRPVWEYNLNRYLQDGGEEWWKAVTEAVMQFQDSRLGLTVDGKLGPVTENALLKLAEKREPNKVDGTEWAEHVFSVAESNIGRGEEGGNNRGPFIREIGGVQGNPWCARFVSHCINEAWNKLAPDDRLCPIGSMGSARALCRKIVKLGGIELEEPVPGGILLWGRGEPHRDPEWWGHVGIADTATTYIAGNEGKFPSLVEVKQFKKHRFEGCFLLPDVALK